MTAFEEGKATVVLRAVVMTEAAVCVRCVRLATGQVVYDFMQPGTGRMTRYDADAYEAAIYHARDKITDEERA